MRCPILTVCFASLSLAACHQEQAAPRPQPRAMPSSLMFPTPEVSTHRFKLAAAPAKVTEEPPEKAALEHSHLGAVDHSDRASALRDDGDLAGALAETRRALYDDPDNTELLEQIAHQARGLGQRGLCAEALREMKELEPDDATPAIREARARIELKDFTTAVAVAREAIERDEGNAEGYHVLGRAYLAMEDLPNAISAFKMAVTLQPEHGYALNNLGFAYLRANRDEDAVQVLSEASGLLPNISYVANNLGVALERMGRKDDAREAYSHAMELSPKYVKAQINALRLNRMASAASLNPELPDPEAAFPIAEPLDADE